MIKLKKLAFKFSQHYKRFGYQGVLFLLKRKFKRNQTIVFSHLKYLYPIILRNSTTDINAFYEVIFDQQYDIAFGIKPKVIIDCGANIGLATIYLKNRFPDAKIISIEPEKSNFEILKRNTREYADVYCLKCGIWNEYANLLVKESVCGNWGFIVEEVNYSDESTISGIPITEIMKKYDIDSIDILKMDIEGSEKELFESNFEEWLLKTKILIIELHDSRRNGASTTFFKALSNYNFSMTHRGENIICFNRSLL